VAAYAPRAESRQHLGGDTRSALTAGIQEAAGQYQPWAVVPAWTLACMGEACGLLFSGTWLDGALEADGVMRYCPTIRRLSTRGASRPRLADEPIAPGWWRQRPALQLAHDALPLCLCVDANTQSISVRSSGTAPRVSRDPYPATSAVLADLPYRAAECRADPARRTPPVQTWWAHRSCTGSARIAGQAGCSPGRRDHTLRLWTGDGQPLRVLEGHKHGVEGALELQDGRLLSWSADHTLRLWTADGQPLRVLGGAHRRGERGLELRDGRLLSWSWDHTLRIWSAEGRRLQLLEGPY